jgi:hypothetical protein
MFGKVYELYVVGVGMDSYATILRTQLELLSGQTIYRGTPFDHHRINKKVNHESPHFNFWKNVVSLGRNLNTLFSSQEIYCCLYPIESHKTLKSDFFFNLCGHYWPIVPAPDDRNEDWQGKPKYSEKSCDRATLSTTNPTWLDPGLKPGRRGGKPATNRLS